MIHVIEPAPVAGMEPLAGESMPRTKDELALAEEKMRALAEASPRDEKRQAFGEELQRMRL
jgi:hypothetical protein